MNTNVFDRCIETSYALYGQKRTGRAFHTSFLLNKNRIRSIGINDYNKTHPRTRFLPYVNGRGERYNAKIHSELSCILKFGEEDCSNLYMVNIRINMNGELAMAMPCFGCEHLIRQTQIKIVYYTNNNGKIEEYYL